jgi:PKD repeat protein
MIAIVVSFSVGVSAAVPLALMYETEMPLLGPQGNGASEVRVVVTIKSLEELGKLDHASHPDFYAVVGINETQYNNKPDNEFWEEKDFIRPGWEFFRMVNASNDNVHISIEIWDEDEAPGNDDDRADIYPNVETVIHLNLDVTTCEVKGYLDGRCGKTFVSEGEGDDAVRIEFKIDVITTVIGLQVTILRVKELGKLDHASDPEFYAVVTIDKTVKDNLAGNEPFEGRDDIWPGWEFTKWINASKSYASVIIAIWDEDEVVGNEDEHGDVKPGPGKDLVLNVSWTPCWVSGDVGGSCDLTFGGRGDGDDKDDVYVVFKIELVEPAYASNLRVKCMHRPVWPKPTDVVNITAESFYSNGTPNYDTDILEIWVNDKNTPAISYWGEVVRHQAGPFNDPSFAYGCRVVHQGVPVFSGWRYVTVGDTASSAAIPVLYTGPKSSSIDIVFIADRDDYTGPDDDMFLRNVSTVIYSGYYYEDVFLRNQDKMNFWLADKMGDASHTPPDDWDFEPPSNWDEDYTFADAGAILHMDLFRDAARTKDRIFSTEPYEPWTARHEAGHIPFSLADEYEPDGGYFETPHYPNIFEELEDCEEDAPRLGRTPSDCRLIEEEGSYWWDDGRWYTSEPAGNDLMDNSGPAQAADIRRIDWLFTMCDSAQCEVPELPRPIPLPLSPPITPAGIGGSPSGGTDPSVEPIPNPIFDDPTKSIVVRLDFNNRTDVTLNSAFVSMQSGHANIGEPPLLRLMIFDDTGASLGRVNAWHPLWLLAENPDGTHERVTLDSATGRFVIPFRDDYGTMKVFENALRQDLIRVDLRTVIRDFCWQNPTDRDCMANFTWSAPAKEGGVIQFSDLSLGPGGDIVAWKWEFGDGSPDSSLQNPTHVYGDNGVFSVKLTVQNSDGLADSVKYDIIVENVDPLVDQDISALVKADITLRIAGEKWHDVSLTLTEDFVTINSVSLTRYPGSPDDQAVTLASQNLNILGGPTLGAVVEYTPDDDPVNGQPNGANPVWIILTMENGYVVEIPHTFNVNHPGTYVWTIDNLLDYVSLVNLPIHFTASATDPGSDDITFDWDWDDGSPNDVATYLNDASIGPDPFPSPEVNPRDVTDNQVHAYANPGTYMITLTVKDDDKGKSVVTLSITI